MPSLLNNKINKASELKDEDLLALSLKSPFFFNEIVGRYQEAFLRSAYKIVKNKEDAEDVAQEAFTKIYFNAKKFKKVEGASLKSWAYKILINTAINHYKKNKKNFERFEYSNDLSRYRAADENKSDADKEDAKSFVGGVLGSLPGRLSGILKKYYLEDKSQKSIASEEGITVTAVKMRLFRAKKAFKEKVSHQTLIWKTLV